MIEVDSQGIQYGTSFGSCGRKAGRIVKVHIRHSNQLTAKRAKAKDA